ncbi:MAG: hypothetical protein ABWY55_05020 [Microbacterium sp.]
MKLYSDFGPRRTRQVFADVIALAFIAAWIWFGVTVYGLIAELAGFGRQMEDAGAGIRETMSEVGENLSGIPLIGSGIRAPFDGASGAGGALEEAGQGQQELVHQLALTVGIGVAALPILMILVLWLVPRGIFIRRATRARALVRAGADIDLLALRALSNQKITTIARVDGQAMAAWRRGDDAVMRRLAALELESSGIRLEI